MTDVEHISRKGTGVPISWFPVLDESELPEGLQVLFRKARESIGFVPNVFTAYSYRPERLSAWFAHYRQLHEPTDNLDAAEREMIALAVSMANGCLYCLVAHGAPWATRSSPTASRSITGVPASTSAAPPSSTSPPRSPSDHSIATRKTSNASRASD
jgi:AhpD family alkylhydroperoxidase